MIAWFFCPYVPDPDRARTRMPKIEIFRDQIEAENGRVAYVEVLGNIAIVKCNLSESLITIIDGTSGFVRIPRRILLDEPLSDLSVTEKRRLSNLIEQMGYTRQEWRDALGGDLGSVTLRDLFRFVTQRRIKPRWDEATNSIVLDGPEQRCTPVDHIDRVV